MMKQEIKLLLVFFMLFKLLLPGRAQENEVNHSYQFKIIKDLPATSVKNQALTSTCWSFSVISMMESELLSMGPDTFDLSEMFVVRHVYEEKADKYIRMHGTINFAGGGFFHDVTHVLDSFGMVPDHVYPGLRYGETVHDHSEMDELLKNYVDKVIRDLENNITTDWKEGYCELLDSCLGEMPLQFHYGNKDITPLEFARELKFDPEDYVEITSFSHHPFYEPFALEVPDNWAWGMFYNVPLDEMIEIICHSLDKGFTVAWSADVSDKGFSWRDGVAVTPEMIITQEIRQEGFDNYATTDDHGMQITGIAMDANGNKYFRVKNSWGLNGSPYNGYLYASEPYVRFKTIAIMVNRKGIPDHICKKLQIY